MNILPTIAYRGKGFLPRPGWCPNTSMRIAVTWPEVVHAAITVGRAHWGDVFRHGLYSKYEMLYRASMIYANLRAYRGRIAATRAFLALDPSEKSAVTYFLGLTFAKLIATRLLAIKWLLHLDVYRDLLQPELMGRSRPDLVGLDLAGEWSVFEAKGRSRAPDRKTKANAKMQTRKLRRIDGCIPQLRVASIAYFSSGSLCVHMEDPDLVDAGAGDLPITEDRLLRDYYRPFTDLVGSVDDLDRMERRESMPPDIIRVTSLPIVGLDVGLHAGIYDALVADLPSKQGDLRSRMSLIAPSFSRPFSHVDLEMPRVHPAADDARFLGPDGILVDLSQSWSPRMMEGQPGKRGA